MSTTYTRRAVLGVIGGLGLSGIAGRAVAAPGDQTTFTTTGQALTLRLLTAGAWDGRRSYLDEFVGGRWVNRATQTAAAWGLAGRATGQWRVTVHRSPSGYDDLRVTLPLPTPATPGTGGLATAYSGAWVGSGGNARAGTFGTWRGRPVSLGLDYLDHGSRSSLFASLDSPGYWIDYPGRKLVLGVPIIDDAKAMTFAAGAAGTYDAHFTNLATALVRGGHADAVLRVAWEANGSFSPYFTTDTAAFRTYWRRVVAAMRAVAGQHFQFDLCMSNTSGPWGDRYPGDDVVDILSTDVYDFDYSDPGHTKTGAQRFSAIRGGGAGLDYLTRLAARTTGSAAVPTGASRPIAVGEWSGCALGDFGGMGGGDDPAWVQAFHDWLAAQPRVVYESYFNDIGGSDDILNGRLPRQAARYRQLFGAGVA